MWKKSTFFVLWKLNTWKSDNIINNLKQLKKMKKLLLTLSLAFFTALSYGQLKNDIRVDNAKLAKQGEEAVLTFDAFSNKCVRRRQLMELSPVLKFNGQEVKASKFEVVGKGRARKLRRIEKRDGITPTAQRYGIKSKIVYTYPTAYSEKMVDSKLTIDRTVKKCKTKALPSIEVPLTIDPSMRPAPVVKETPKVVIPKEKKLDITLDDAVSFKVGKSVLDMDMKNNKASADKIIAALKEIKDTKGAKITEITISGFASPEGSFELNNRLSQERAVSFMEAIIPAADLEKWMFKVEAGGENWAQLKTLIEGSTLKTKASLLKVIDSTEDQTARQGKLQSMAAYNYIFKTFYPQLRNAGWVKIAYTVTE